MASKIDFTKNRKGEWELKKTNPNKKTWLIWGTVALAATGLVVENRFLKIDSISTNPSGAAEAFANIYRGSEVGSFLGGSYPMNRDYLTNLSADYPNGSTAQIEISGNSHNFVIGTAKINGEPVLSLREGGDCVGAAIPQGTDISAKDVCNAADGVMRPKKKVINPSLQP